MAPRSTWKGFLKLSLVSVPVKAYTATTSDGGEIRLNQLHAECHSRINYKKTCPIHGEVSGEQIVSGYEYAKGQYVVIDTDELDKLRTEDDKAIKIDTFFAPDALDPVYQSGKTYYLVPDGPVGQKAYGVIHRAMIDMKRHAIARVVMHGKEQTVLVRPIGNLLSMSVLSYETQITKPSAFDEEVTPTEPSKEELQLARTLIESSTAKKLDFSQYKDIYTERLTQLIEAKVAGKELVAAPVHEEAQIINLMDALRESVAKAKGAAAPKKASAAAARPPRKVAPSRKPAAVEEKRKRKTS